MAAKTSALSRIAKLQEDFEAAKQKELDGAKLELKAMKVEIRTKMDAYNIVAVELDLPEIDIAPASWRGGTTSKTGTRARKERTAVEVKEWIEKTGKISLSSLPESARSDEGAIAFLGNGFKVTHTGKRGMASVIVEKK